MDAGLHHGRSSARGSLLIRPAVLTKTPGLSPGVLFCPVGQELNSPLQESPAVLMPRILAAAKIRCKAILSPPANHQSPRTTLGKAVPKYRLPWVLIYKTLKNRQNARHQSSKSSAHRFPLPFLKRQISPFSTPAKLFRGTKKPACLRRALENNLSGY